MLGRTWVPSRRHTDLRQPGQVSGAAASASGTESGFFNYGRACMKRLMISAMASGSGKTVLTCGLLAALTARGHAPRR